MKRPSNPANGERGAMIGYRAQYLLAADLIYSRIVDGTIEWIRIADPEAGRVDDIQIAAAGRLDAYQIKWGEFVETVTFKQLTSDLREPDGKSKPSLMWQLADGWQRLCQARSGHRVMVHLITRDVPSVNDKVSQDSPSPKHNHFQSFLRECWEDRNWAEAGLGAVPKGWLSAIKIVQTATALSYQDFLRFCIDCDLRFQYQLPADRIPSGESTRRNKDVEQLSQLLVRLAGSDKRIVQLTRQELLVKLGWQKRFQLHFRHEFWVDERLYQPITSTASELESSLERLTQGYLALLGTPGSGKSTTLTQTLRYRKGFRFIPYYAYVPDDPRQGRGEAVHFLHDMVVSLRDRGIGRGELVSESPQELQECLAKQLMELSEDWTKHQIKTIILVDGLDHIEREQHPHRTLLADLPLPEAVPEGVILVLGSQKLDLIGLSPRIQAHLNQPGRILRMHPLSRPATIAILEAALLAGSVSHEQKERIYTMSGGHPLALRYLLNRLKTAADRSAVDLILQETDPYQGHVDQDYEVYWQSLEADHDIRRLLALVSRLRGPIDLTKIHKQKWVKASTLEHFVIKLRHFFETESDTRWRFFHNSFRQFVLAKTKKNPLGLEDPELDREYHRQLADFAAKSEPNSAWSWEELFHRYWCREYSAVIKMGSQDNLRRQFFGFRSWEDILDDIHLCLRTARREQNGLAIIRLLLIEKELSERNQHIPGDKLPRLLLALGDVDIALRWVIRGRGLLVSETEALNFCGTLLEKRMLDAARAVFEAAEPLDLLSGSDHVNAHRDGDLSLLKLWASVAHHFRALDRILEAIDQLQVDQSPPFVENPEAAPGHIRTAIVRALIDAVCGEGKPSKVEALRRLVAKQKSSTSLCVHLDFNLCEKPTDPIQSQAAFERILNWAQDGRLVSEDRTLIGELTLRIRNDAQEAAKWIEGIQQPPGYNRKTHRWDWKGLSPFIQRFRLNRLLSALGGPIEPAVAVPAPSDAEELPGAIFERMIVIIANVWGHAWAGKPIDSGQVVFRLQPAMTLYERWSSLDRSHHWHEIRGAAKTYFSFLIRAAAAHGADTVVSLGNEFEARWVDSAAGPSWPADWRRHIALELYRAGDSRDSLARRLEPLEKEIDLVDNLGTRVERSIRQALAWIESGQPQRARDLLPKVLGTSFGIYDDEDNQFDHWVSWLARANCEHPRGIEERIRRFAGALVIINQAHRGSGIQDSAAALINIAACWSPGYALELRSWLMDHGALHYTSGLEGLLMASLKSLDPPVELAFTLTRHLLIPFERRAVRPLGRFLASSAHQVLTRTKATVLVESLIHAIDTKAFPSDRTDWYRSIIEGLKEAEVPTDWLMWRIPTGKKDDGVTRPVIHLSSGESLTEEVVWLRCRSYEELLALLKSTARIEHFRWERTLKGIVEHLTVEQIHILQSELERFTPGSAVSAIFAARLAALGQVEEAKQLACKVIKGSSPSGWNRWYDGGTRISAARCLIAVHGESGRRQALELLVDDYFSGRFPSTILQSLDELVSILFDISPVTEIWVELEKHIYQLAEFSEAKEFPSHSDIESELSHGAMLIRLVFADLDIPVPELREEIHKAICELTLAGIEAAAISGQIRALLTKSEDSQFQGLALLESISGSRPDFLVPFSTQIEGLCSSRNMIVRKMALGLAQTLQLSRPTTTIPAELSPIYRLELPQIGMPNWTIPLDAIPEGEPFPDIEDPLEMVRPFEPDFEIVAKLSKIPLQNLLARAVGLMKTLSPTEQWNRRAEESLRAYLTAAEIKIAYRRPRPALALRAFAHIVAELFDSGVLTKPDLAELRYRTVLHDRTLSVVEPKPRPPSVVVPLGHRIGSFRTRDWIDSVPEAIPLLTERIEQGWVVLGELGRFVSMDWGKPAEYRFAMVCHPEWPSPDSAFSSYDFFPYRASWCSFDYPRLAAAQRFPSTVVYGNPFRIEIGSTEWLALNPAIPEGLGWVHSAEGLFRWLDSQGQLIVESLWWRDGSIHRTPPRSKEICSEGWLVVATREGAELILEAVGKAVRIGTVIRECDDREEGGKTSNFAVAQKEFGPEIL